MSRGQAPRAQALSSRPSVAFADISTPVPETQRRVHFQEEQCTDVDDEDIALRRYRWDKRHQPNVKTWTGLPEDVTVLLVLPEDQGGSRRTRKDNGDQNSPWWFRSVQDHSGLCKNIFQMNVLVKHLAATSTESQAPVKICK
ncbi:hypothetical protein B9Z19DRAFT_1134392 [Tuber borchii]|uniref:Uncharacterized protein n=1 Tax=Tuber borchii TaxID=42251 RepID=A0A2T6ZEA9_TUBBO|nr:hypothetical protein B9Z19DRAFT_1134392 [Tuber borchii]